MTLRGEHDFKLYDSTCAPYETFEAYYGVLDNGDIYYPANIEQFCSHVKLQTKNDGVHFVMADGVRIYLYTHGQIYKLTSVNNSYLLPVV